MDIKTSSKYLAAKLVPNLLGAGLNIDRQALVRRQGLEVGASVYQAITQPLSSILRLLDKLAALGITLTEFFIWFNWQNGWMWSPHLQVGTVTENGEVHPIWSLIDFSPDVQKKLDAIYDGCFERRIIPVSRLHDFCSIKKTDRWFKRRYSWSHNVQNQKTYSGGLYGHPEPTFGISRYYALANTWLIHRIEAGGGQRARAWFVPMNEADYRANEEEQQLPVEYHNAKVVKFHKFYIDDLTRKGIPRSNILISTSRAFDELATLGCPMEIHGINSDESFKRALQKYEPYTKKGVGLFLNGDGPDPYAKGRRGDAAMKREPSRKQAFAIGQLMKKYHTNYSGFLRAADTIGLQAMMNDARPEKYLDAADYLVRGILS